MADGFSLGRIYAEQGVGAATVRGFSGQCHLLEYHASGASLARLPCIRM